MYTDFSNPPVADVGSDGLMVWRLRGQCSQTAREFQKSRDKSPNIIHKY